MTKPTQEQIQALKPGDRVLVEATIGKLCPDHDGDVWLTVMRPRGEHQTFCAPSAIHSILPREITVGDRVRHKVSGTTGDVLFVDDFYAFVRGPNGHLVPHVDDLDIIP